MTHYHGTPISPDSAAADVLAGRHAFISFGTDRQADIAREVCQSFALDNGAFGAWRGGAPITDWAPYYRWAEEHLKHPACDWAVIPDVIDGSEADNDALIEEWPLGLAGVPVWHLHESLPRLRGIIERWPRVALGSSGKWDMPGTPAWWERMAEAMAVVCDSEGRPVVKLHGLRMLNPEVFSRLPLASADSVNVGRNVGMDGAWRGPYEPPTKAWRAQVIAARIRNSPSRHAGVGPGSGAMDRHSQAGRPFREDGVRNDFDQDSLHQIAADETLPPAVRLAALDRIRPFPWWTVAYVASVVAVNVLWGVVPWVGSFVVGAIFMVRDAAQEEIGTRVLWATAAGVLLSYLMASPGVALASAAAFAIGEGTDFLMCRWLRDQPLRSRMLITQPVNVAMDTSVFLLGLQMGIGLPWSWSMFGIQCASKMAALVVLTRRSAP